MTLGFTRGPSFFSKRALNTVAARKPAPRRSSETPSAATHRSNTSATKPETGIPKPRHIVGGTEQMTRRDFPPRYDSMDHDYGGWRVRRSTGSWTRRNSAKISGKRSTKAIILETDTVSGACKHLRHILLLRVRRPMDRRPRGLRAIDTHDFSLCRNACTFFVAPEPCRTCKISAGSELLVPGINSGLQTPMRCRLQRRK